MEHPTRFPRRPGIVRRRQKPQAGSARVRAGNRTCKAVRRIVCCVQSSLPCVSMRGRRIRRHRYGHSVCGYRLPKPSLQKRLRLWCIPPWKSPRLSKRGRQEIAVRTQWQSGSQHRQRLTGQIKWKRPARQRQVPSGEIQPDLSRKINPACRRHLQTSRKRCLGC